MCRQYREDGVPQRRADGILVWRTDGVDCSVKPFCTQNGEPFEWLCVLGTIGPQGQIRVTGSAKTEDEAIRKADKYAEAIHRVYYEA